MGSSSRVQTTNAHHPSEDHSLVLMTFIIRATRNYLSVCEGESFHHECVGLRVQGTSLLISSHTEIHRQMSPCQYWLFLILICFCDLLSVGDEIHTAHICGSLYVYVCSYKEGVADRMLCVSSLQHPLCCHGETVLCFPIGGEINTIFNWPGGLPPVWEIV